MASFNSTLGASDATSYISRETANGIMENTMQAATWAALTDDEKELSLIASTTALDGLAWAGTRCSPSTDDDDLEQALQWPRHDASCKGVTAVCTAIPFPIQQACAMLALQLHSNPNSIISGGPVSSKGPVKREKLGDLEMEYFDPRAQESGEKISDSAPIVIKAYPWLVDLLNCWLLSSYGVGGTILRVRS